MNIFKRVEITDILQLTGLGLFGTGLYFIYGLGWSFVATGAVFILLGYFGQKVKV